MTSNDTLRDLITRIATQGRVKAIVIRPERNEPAQYVDAVKAEPGLGLIGDRRAKNKRTDKASRKRELSLIQAEHLPLIASWCGIEQLETRKVVRPLRRLGAAPGIRMVDAASTLRSLRAMHNIFMEQLSRSR